MVSRREIVSGSNLTEVALVGMCRDYMVVNCILIIYRVVSLAVLCSSARTLSRPLGRPPPPPDLPPSRGVASLAHRRYRKNGDCHQFASHHDPRNKALSLKRIGWLYPIFLTQGLHFRYGSICLNSGRRLLPSNS